MGRNYCWGILSTGKIAHKFVQDLQLVDSAQITAVCSRSQERAGAFAQQYNIDGQYSNLDQFLQDDRIDIVYIASPHTLHKEHTIVALEAGKHVLCEKPIAMNADDARELYSLARQKGLFLMEAMWTVFLPHYQKMKTLIEEGMIGISTNLLADFSFSVPYDLSNRVINPELGGGALLDVGLYPLMLSLDVHGPLAKVSAQAIKTPHGVDASTSILIQHKSGALSTISCSIQQKGPQTAHILGSDGHIVMGPRWWTPSALHIHSDQGVNDHTPSAQGHGYHYETRHVHNMIDNNRISSDIWTPSRSLELMDTLDKIREIIDLKYDQDR